ncbi:hypothetical protein [Pseudomonas sp. DTU12.3]|uniref:hypothetical protein n=1 Tax=Pseudomonas sp. DTU12.3 TaxID=2073078 RepID=UPI001011DE6B|nr:hypothetical protein [Pseudomonas sp. DTU12.3]
MSIAPLANHQRSEKRVSLMDTPLDKELNSNPFNPPDGLNRLFSDSSYSSSATVSSGACQA